MPHLTRRAWSAVAVAIAGLGAAGIAIAGAQGDETPHGTDPLSTTELEEAAALARGSNPGESTGLGDDDVVLLVERHEEAKNAPEDQRRADVYVYSYDDDVLTWSVVDLSSGEVDQSQELTGEQLPLVDEEVERARAIADENPEYSSAVATAYRQATGRDLTDPATELVVQPLVFRADQNPGLPGTQRCGEHRCAQFLIQTADGLLVNLFPVVDLSAERVASVRGGAR